MSWDLSTEVTRERVLPSSDMRLDTAMMLVVMGCANASKPESTVNIDDLSAICMVNDRYMGQPQIPVVAEGRTYYGCCAGCVARLKSDPAVRAAVDPVTGNRVDKATAAAARLGDGRVLYFENAQSRARYRP